MHVDQIQYAKRFDGITGSAIREIFKMIAQPGMISFAGGNPSPAALPDETVRRIAGDVLRDDGKTILQYGATEGYRPFLESLKPYAEYTYRWFDPINGEYVSEGTFKASGMGTWFAGVRPTDTDMVLLVQKAH